MQSGNAKKKTFKNPFSETAQNVFKPSDQESSRVSVEAVDGCIGIEDGDKCQKNVDQTLPDGDLNEPCGNKSSDVVKEQVVNRNISQSIEMKKKAVPCFQASKKENVQIGLKQDNKVQTDKQFKKKNSKKEKNENGVPKQEKVVEKTKKTKVQKQTKSELPPLTRDDYEDIFKAVLGSSYTYVGLEGNDGKTECKEEEKLTLMEVNCDKEGLESMEKTNKIQIDYENREEMTEVKSITTENKKEVNQDQEMKDIDSGLENTEEVAEKSNTCIKRNFEDEETTENKGRMDMKKEKNNTCAENIKKKKKTNIQGENENNKIAGGKEKKKKAKSCNDYEITDNTEKVKKKKKVKKANDETTEIKKKKKDQRITKVKKIIETEEGKEITKVTEVKECSNENVEHENEEEMAHSLLNNTERETLSSSIDNDDQNPSGLDSCNEIQQVNEVTPEGSEVDGEEHFTQKTDETPAPMKKPKMKSGPKKVIKPKQLHFGKSDLDTVKNGSNKKKVDKKMEQLQDVEVRRKKNVDRKQIFISREYISCGTWVQCCDCEKWRLLSKIDDPTELPDRWICKMNTDESFNSCEKSEQSYDESDHIFTKYSEGTVVWARIAGYPWWPAMIELDPDTESFYEVVKAKSQYPTHYHVVFFDEKVTRSWVKSSSLMQFVGKENLDLNLKGGKHVSFKKDIHAAKENALNALKLPVKERIKQYSFGVRFKGKWCKSVEEILSEDKDDHVRERKQQKAGKKRTKSERQRATADNMIDVLDNTTVDDILQNPDDVLKGFEEVLESIDSEDELVEIHSTDVKKAKFDFESESDEDIDKKLNVKQNKKEKQVKTKKKEKEQKFKSKKVKKRKLNCDDEKIKQSHSNKTVEKDDEPSDEPKCDTQKDDKMKFVEISSEKESISEVKNDTKFDSEILNMDMDSSEHLQSVCDKASKKDRHAKLSVQKKNKFSVPSKSKNQYNNDACFDSDSSVKPVNQTLEVTLEENLNLEKVDKNVFDAKSLEQGVEFKFEELDGNDKMNDPNEQTVPSLDNDVTEEENDELSLEIPVNVISKYSTANIEINTNVAVLVTDYDTEGSDPFDMEE